MSAGGRAAAECGPDLFQARVQPVVEMDERVLRPYRTLEFLAAYQLPVALEKMRQRARQLRPEPRTPSVLQDLPRCAVELRPGRTEYLSDKAPP